MDTILPFELGICKESALKVKRVGEVSLILVSAPSYIKAEGKIMKPEDLKERACLSLSVGRTVWALRSSSGSSAQVTVRSRIISNQMSSLLNAAVAGAGVALVPAFLARSRIEAGDLVRVLPQWRSQGVPVSMLSPISFSASARLRTATDYFLTEMQNALELDI